jgi:gamma-glutamylcyclotransferase
LDRYEGVPEDYAKQMLKISPVKKDGSENWKGRDSPVEALVYVDTLRQTLSPPKQEYIARMNHAISDGEDLGVPKQFIKDILRKSIPEIRDETAHSTVAR